MVENDAFRRKLDRLLQQVALLQAVDQGVVSAVCPSRLRLSLFTAAAELREERARPASEVIAPCPEYKPGSAT